MGNQFCSHKITQNKQTSIDTDFTLKQKYSIVSMLLPEFHQVIDIIGKIYHSDNCKMSKYSNSTEMRAAAGPQDA